MRILITADPEIEVPPKYYGGIERIIDMLVRELIARGHEMTLLARPGSTPACELAAWPGKSSLSRLDTVRNAMRLSSLVSRRRFDLIHSFSRLAYLTAVLPLRLPKLMTYQREITPGTVRKAHAISRGSLWFSGISQWMIRDVKGIGEWRTVPNGVPLETYRYREKSADDGPLVFLGRVEEIKGPHLAIEIARKSGRRLVIAGNIPEEHKAWADEEVLTHVDGDEVQFIGPVDDAQKNELLGSASAFLMPILWEEPFGIVMAEAMACGTPVLGLKRGAVPEVVEDGRTGFVAETVDELVRAVRRIDSIDRAACRQRVEQYYSEKAVADGYLAIYQEMLERAGG